MILGKPRLIFAFTYCSGTIKFPSVVHCLPSRSVTTWGMVRRTPASCSDSESQRPPRTNMNDRGFEIGLGARNLLRESILKVRLVWASKGIEFIFWPGRV